jgi:3-oxoacyl-[acyl-carrier-protein] synthase-3
MQPSSVHSPTEGAAVSNEVAVARNDARDAAGSTSDSNEKTDGKLFQLSQRTNSLLGVRIVGCGSYVPERVVTNEELEERYGFEPGWIQRRTGIESRRYASPKQATSDLCVEAAERAIQAAGVNPQDIDLLVVGTFTADFHCPSTACLVQERLGLDAPAVDLQAACAGFMYALVTAAQYVATGNSKLALVIGGDVNSRIVNPHDQGTAPLFGDGAGAVLVERGDANQGLLCYQMGSDGGGGGLLDRPCGGTRNPFTASNTVDAQYFVQMDGRNVFKWAIRALSETIELVLTKSDLKVDDVGLYVLHQANIRIIDYAVERLGISRDKVFNNLVKYGNTSGGSIPIVLDEAYRDGRIKQGDIILMSGFGAGLSWGTALFRW